MQKTAAVHVTCNGSPKPGGPGMAEFGVMGGRWGGAPNCGGPEGCRMAGGCPYCCCCGAACGATPKLGGPECPISPGGVPAGLGMLGLGPPAAASSWMSASVLDCPR